MKHLEEDFSRKLLAQIEQAAHEHGVQQNRLTAQVTKFGGVRCAKDLVRRGQLSDGFDALAQAGTLSLSLESLVVCEAYGTLFTDDEVNTCFAALCEGGYYAGGQR